MSDWQVLRTNPDFRRYFAADIVSTLGSQLSVIAFPLLVLALGNGPAQAGLVGTCSLVTRLVFRLPAGHLTDRVDRRWLMLITDLIRLFVIASIPVAAGLGLLSLPQLLVVAVIEGIATAAFGPAATVAIRDVVAPPDLPAALGRLQAVSAVALLAGPALGGFLFSVDRILPFTVDALSYGISAVLLITMTVRAPERAPAGERDDRVTAGLRWLRHQPALLWVLLFVGTLNFGGAALEVGAVLALRGRGVASSEIGLVMACLGIGSVVGALMATRLVATLAAGRLLVLIGLIWTAGFVVLAIGPPVPVIGAALLILLLVTPAAGIQLGQALLVNTPRDLLGRVNTAIGTVTAGLASLGPLLIGIALNGIGNRGAWLALGCLIAAVTALTARPLLRMNSLVAGDQPAVPSAPTEQPLPDGQPAPVASVLGTSSAAQGDQ